MRREENIGSGIEAPISAYGDGRIEHIRFWDGLYGGWHTSPPTFPVGLLSQVDCGGRNLTNEVRFMYFVFFIYDPTGKLVDNPGSGAAWVAPGEAFTAGGYGVITQKPGDYTTRIDLYLDYEKVDSVTVVVAHVTAIPEVDAKIENWWFWDYETDDWVAVSPTLVPQGENIGVRVRAENTGTSKLNMRARVYYYSPSGVQKTKLGGILTVDPGEWVNVLWDFLWKADEEGDWKADIILYACLLGGTLEEIDRKENLDVANVSKEVVPPEEEYKGTIIKKQLEVSGIAGLLDIPVTQEITEDSRAKVHVYTRNTGTLKYHPNCQWEVRDPQGNLATSYNHTAFDLASPGEETHFFEAIETFTLRNIGDYSLELWLLAAESGEVLDYWGGKLCTVVEEVIPPECTIDADCPEGYACVAGKCVLIPPECTIDADCPEGYLCVDGVCVPEEEVEKKFPWVPVALVGGGVAIAIAATAKKKKKT